jgi:O-antigen/teichoic acid export membrane protein
VHKSIFSLGFIQGLGYVFPFVTLGILARGLDGGDMSAFLYAQSLGALLAIPVEYGFHLSAVRLASNAAASGRMGEACSEVLFARAFLYVLAIFAVIPVIVTNAVLPLTVLNTVGVLLTIAAYGFKPLWYFQATDNYGKVIRTELLANIVSFCSVAAIAQFPAAHGWIVVTWALPRAAGVARLVFTIHREAGFYIPRISRVVAILKEAFPLFIHKIAAGAVHMATPVLLAYLITSSDLAAYQKSERIVTAVQSLLLVISQVGYAQVMRSVSGPGAGAARSKANQASVLQVGISVLATLGIYFTAPLLLMLFWGSVDPQALTSLRVMAFLLPVLGVNAAIALNYLLPMKMDSVVVGAAVVGSLLSMGLLFVLSGYFGPLTGVGGVIAGELAMTLIMGAFLWRAKGNLMAGHTQSVLE